MTYNVLITETAQKDLKNLDNDTKKRILEKLKYLLKDPIAFSRKLVNSKTGEYRFRIGDYRIIFDIDDKNIAILKIGHRKDIYE